MIYLMRILLAFLLSTAVASAQTPPLAHVNVSMPAPGAVVAVPAGTDLQAALNAAVPGSTLLLDAGATYVGNFVLPNKAKRGWITIASNADRSRLPAPGQRVTPLHAPFLPKIVSPNQAPAIDAAPGAHQYRLVGLDIATTAAKSYGVVVLGASDQKKAAEAPSYIVLDRVYVHGPPDADVRRGVLLNGKHQAVIDSWISEMHERGADTQAIAGWNGPGPFLIQNNYLEAAGENILFGGADPSLANLVPSDITIRGNLLQKPAAWRTAPWTVKNLLELKNARRVVIDGNTLTGNWRQAQTGYAVLFTPRNQDGKAPWSVVEDVAFTGNTLTDSDNGINILGIDNLQISKRTARIRIARNAVTNVRGVFLMLLDGPASVTVEQNTVLQTGNPVVASGVPAAGFVFARNIINHGEYGFGGDGTFGNVALTLSRYFPGLVWSANAVIGGKSGYPADTLLLPTVDAVRFRDVAGGDLRLRDDSPCHTTTQDIGAFGR